MLLCMLRAFLKSLFYMIGLDPAGLSFENSEPEARLNPTDAKYVEAIHTDQESLTALGNVIAYFLFLIWISVNLLSIYTV